MAPRKKSGKAARRIQITKIFASRLTEYLDYYAALADRYPAALVRKLQETTLPRLQNFPESGRAIEDLTVLEAFSDSRAVVEVLATVKDLSSSLTLREIILDKNFKILYGYDTKNVILLAIKHMAKKEYDF